MNEFLLSIIAALLTAIGGLFMLLYRDITRRLGRLERKASTILLVMTVLMGSLPNISSELLKSIEKAVVDGDSHVG